MSRLAPVFALVSLLATGTRSLSAQVSLQAGALVGRAEHRILDEGMLLPTAGTVLGAAVAATVRRRFEIRAEALGGHFATTDPSIDDHDLAELNVLGSVTVQPWLSVQAGPVFRSLSNPLARQHWTMFRLGGEARVPLAFDRVRGVLRGYWMPVASISGLPRPDIALTMATGLEWRGRLMVLSMSYHLERYDFPASAGARRLEELSSLQIRVGLFRDLTPRN